MPCNIGYKEVARARIPKPVPKKFKATVKPPEIDRDLLEKIGEEDPAFIEWASELNIRPLLEEALSRALKSVGDIQGVEVRINEDGSLEITGKHTDDYGKKRLEKFTKELSDRFQMEVLGIVAELLEYEVEISKETEEGQSNLVLEAEKHQHSHGHVNRYLKITKGEGDEEGSLRFEHFASPEELKSEKEKFLALAQKMGVKLNLETTEKSGQPITNDAVHTHFLKGRG